MVTAKKVVLELLRQSYLLKASLKDNPCNVGFHCSTFLLIYFFLNTENI